MPAVVTYTPVKDKDGYIRTRIDINDVRGKPVEVRLGNHYGMGKEMDWWPGYEKYGVLRAFFHRNKVTGEFETYYFLIGCQIIRDAEVVPETYLVEDLNNLWEPFGEPKNLVIKYMEV